MLLAGFDGTTGYNRFGRWIDSVALTEHDRRLEEDYERVRAQGFEGVRESVRWPLIERRGRYDFTPVLRILEASRRHGLSLFLDLFHFGYPTRTAPLGPERDSPLAACARGGALRLFLQR